jgi:hypothetical protein
MKIMLKVMFLCLVPGVMMGQEIHELYSGQGAVPYTTGVAMDQKKDPNPVVLGVDGKIYSMEDGEWTMRSKDFEATRIKFGADKKGDMHVAGLTSGTLVLWESKDLGSSWEETGSYSFAQGNPDFYTLDGDLKSGELFMIYSEKTTEGESCKLSYQMVSTSSMGKKWSDPILLNEGGAKCDNIAASMTSFKDGKRFAIWLDGEKFKVDRSYDGKKWLSSDISITTTFLGNLTHGLPEMVMDNSKTQLGGMIYLVGESVADSVSSVWMRKTANLGDVWTSNLPLDPTFKGDQYYPTLRVDNSTGVIYTAWYGKSEEGFHAYLGYSVNGGQKFTNKRLSETPFGGFDSDKIEEPISLEAMNGKIVITWLEFYEEAVSQKVMVLKQDDLFKTE